MTRHKFGRVLEHVDEAVQLAQNVVGQVLAGFGFAVDVDGHIGVFAAHFFDEGAQVEHGWVHLGAGAELVVINRQDKRAGAALLLGKLAQVAIAGYTQHLEAFFFNGFCQGAYAKARGVFGAVIFVDDDYGEAKFQGQSPRK